MEVCYAFSMDAFVAFINTQFFSSMAGALAGAFFGAVAAHSISMNSREKSSLEEQLKSTNAGIMSSFLICNSLLSMKKQQVAEMYKDFCQKRMEYRAALANPVPGSVLSFEADLKKLRMPLVPMEVLATQAYEKLSLRGRPLGLVSAISNALSSLEESLSVRDQIIEQYKRFHPSVDDKTKIDFYFGLPLPDGSVSTEYADSLEGINQYTNDAIFFSALLCKDLEKYGNKLRDRYIKKYGGEVEVVSSLKFDEAESLGLMPNEKDYENWLGIFGELSPVVKRPWYKRIWH